MFSNIPIYQGESNEPAMTDREVMETELIRALISSYFNIVRESIADQVPKAIMHLLVNHSKDVVQNRLVSELYKENLFEELLYEDWRVVSMPVRQQRKDLSAPVLPCSCLLLCDLGQVSVRSAVSSLLLFEPFSLPLLLLKMQTQGTVVRSVECDSQTGCCCDKNSNTSTMLLLLPKLPTPKQAHIVLMEWCYKQCATRYGLYALQLVTSSTLYTMP